MAEAAEQSADIAGDGAHISALAAVHHELGLVAGGLQNFEPVNGDGPRLQFDKLALAREIIGALAGDLDRRILRWRLQNIPDKPGQQRGDRAGFGSRVALADDLAVGVVGVGLGAPAHGEEIGLLAILHEGHGLGGLAEGDRQNARGQRIERAGVAGLLAIIDALQARDGLRRGHADRLVEHDPAVDDGAVRSALIH